MPPCCRRYSPTCWGCCQPHRTGRYLSDYQSRVVPAIQACAASTSSGDMATSAVITQTYAADALRALDGVRVSRWNEEAARGGEAASGRGRDHGPPGRRRRGR